MIDPIAPVPSIGRPTPPTVAFGTSSEDEGDPFDYLLRENERAEKPEPNRSSDRRDEPRVSDESRASDEPARPAARETEAKDEAPARTDTDRDEQPAAKAETDSTDDKAPADETATTTADDGADTAAEQQAATSAANAATTAAATAPEAAGQAAAAAAAATPRASITGQTNAAPNSAAANAGNELPTLQSLQAGKGAGDANRQDGAPRQQQGEGRLPEALQQLLQRSTGGETTASTGNAANTASNSFRAALESTALATTLKPDTAAAAPNPAVLPTAAAAPVTPATAAAPLPAVDPMNPIAGQGGIQSAEDAGGTLKSTATHGAAPGRAATPVATPSLQIAMHIAKAAQDGTNRLSVRLDPAELGRVDVRLEVGHDGRVQALVSAERQETLDMLQRDSRDLMRALKDAGLEANAGDLNFSLRDNGGQETLADGRTGNGGGRNGDGDRPMADEPNAAGMAELEAERPRPQVAGSGALDITV